MKYIDAEELKIELDRKKIGYNIDGKHKAEYDTCVKVLRIIDSLQREQPGFDLEKEIEEHVKGMPMSEFTHESEIDDYWDWAREEFRYFFELGLNARKEENK